MGQVKTKIRYAVVSAGNIMQAAVLPAFRNARENSELVAIISGDAQKRAALSKQYKVELTGDYPDLEEILERGAINAVYIAAPNAYHRTLTERAASMGVHVLCEKPMATSVRDCEAMIETTRRARVKLMIAYRLHFEEANLRAIEMVRLGELGKLKILTSVFTQQVRFGDIRTQAVLGGGALFDMGVYPINAARNLFRDEPIEVSAFQPPSLDPRFAGVDESMCVSLRFAAGGVAQLTVSIGTAPCESYRLLGERGCLRMEPCFGVSSFSHFLTLHGRTTEHSFPKRDQFAPELIYFSRCIIEDREPEPSGEEGWCDVRVACAALESVRTGRAISLTPFVRRVRPDLSQNIHKPFIEPPRLVGAPAPILTVR